jgi:glutathione S-transferase
MSKEFEAMNPKRRVPVLIMGDEVITEMAAVLTAIATVAPEAHLFGKTALEKIRVYEWLNYLSTTAHGQAIAEIWRTERFTNNTEIYPQLRAKGYETMREILAHIEAKFISANITEFAVGNSYTAADSFLAVLYIWTAKFTEVTINVDNDYPVYAAYAKKMLERSAFVEARRIHKM